MAVLPSLTALIWPATFAAGFIAGVTYGRYQERHKETLTMRNFANAYVQWYTRWAPVVVTSVAALALVGIWIGAAATITNGRQDVAAQQATKKVQACFDRYAVAQSASSSAVREASAAKDVATAAFNRALNEEGRAFKSVVNKLRTKTLTIEAFDRLAESLEARDRAGRAVVDAQAALDRARKENPVPAAPSEFCSVKP